LTDEKAFKLIQKLFLSKNSKKRKMMVSKSNATNQKIIAEIFQRIYSFILEILISESQFC